MSDMLIYTKCYLVDKLFFHVLVQLQLVLALILHKEVVSGFSKV